MKIKKGFEIRTVCGENVIVGQGIENIDFSKIISLNESGAYLWRKMAERENKTFEVADLTEALLAEYEVDAATAQADCQSLAAQWLDAGIVE